MLMSVWIGLLIVIAVVWVSRHRALTRAQRGEQPLSSSTYADPPNPCPAVSVLVAAKDEQNTIEACVHSLLTQDYPDLEVIAIDDRSQDDTPLILQRLAESAQQTPLKVLTVTELREGWFGKNNAMHEGVAVARGQWLCFTDADCRQVSQHTISVAMRYAIEHQVAFLSVLPVLETHSFWERVLQPVCAAIMVMWFRPEKVNNPESPAAYANGAFMLMTRELYEAIGGHERFKTEVNEDMHMARRTKSLGRRLRVVQNDDLYRTRMYDNLTACWRGWSRIFYGCFGSFWRLAVSATVLFLSSILPWVSVVAGAVGAMVAPEPGPWQLLAGAGVVTLMAQQTLLFRFYRINKADTRYLPTYPLGAMLALGMLLNAMTKLRGLTTTTWRGTRYRGSELAA